MHWLFKFRQLLQRDVVEPMPDEHPEASAPFSLSESTRGHVEGQDSPAVDEPWEGSDWHFLRRSWSACEGQG